MPRHQRPILMLIAIVLSFGAVFAQERPGSTEKRTKEQIKAAIDKQGEELDKLLVVADVFSDSKKRQEIAAKAIPAVRRLMALYDELALAMPEEKDQLAMMRVQIGLFLSVLGDNDARAELEKLAANPKEKLSLDAKLALKMVAYWKDPKNQAGQLKALEEMQKLAKANPAKAEIADMLDQMSRLGFASTAVSDKAQDIIITDLTSDRAREIADRIKGERKLRDSLSKPVEIAGTTVDGKAFTTKDWKGKVILVDFWATWCGACKAELPDIKKAYLEYHAKGLEILGVSCDESGNALKDYLDKNKDMPWPQLFDAEKNPKAGWHPLGKEWGIDAIPRLFLIDRKGVLRSVDARKVYGEMIPKLIEEKE